MSNSIDISTLTPSLQSEISSLCSEILSLKSEAQTFLDAAESLRLELDEILSANNLPTISIPSLKASIIRTTRKSISKEALIDNGVSIEVIEASTKESASFIQVRRIGEKEKAK